MVIAADYPFLDVLWTMILFFAWVIWIWMMIVILGDVFRRRDIGGWTKAAWTVFLIVIPFLAALVYLILHHDDMAERRLSEAQAMQSAVDDHIREVASGPAGEIERAKTLLDQGAIDEREFADIKRRALA